MKDTEILSIISCPSKDVTFNDSTSVMSSCGIQKTVRFKYKISGVPFHFSWELTKADSSILIFPLLDALLRLKKQILEFRKLPNSDPKLLDQLPSYSDFNVKKMLDEYEDIEKLTKKCDTVIKVRSSSSPSSKKQSPAIKSRPQKDSISPRQAKGALKYQAAKRGLFAVKQSGNLFDTSDSSSQMDSQDMEEDKEEDNGKEVGENEKKKLKADETSPKPTTRLRSTFKL